MKPIAISEKAINVHAADFKKSRNPVVFFLLLFIPFILSPPVNSIVDGQRKFNSVHPCQALRI